MHVIHVEEIPAVWRLRLSPGDSDGIFIDQNGLTQLDEALAAAETSSHCRVIIIEGQPGTFCSGIDLRKLTTTPAADFAVRSTDFAECLRRILRSSKYTMAIIDGVVQGGGVGIAAATDMVIATADSSFGLPEAVLGLVPAIVMPILMQRMPLQKVRHLALQGTIDAPTAKTAGLVDRVVSARSELGDAFQAAVKHALRLNPSSVRKLKALAEQIEGMPCEAGLQNGKNITAELFADPKTRAHIQKFMEGSLPPWFQRYRPRGSRKKQSGDSSDNPGTKRSGPFDKGEDS